MQIAVISDLHLGAHPLACRFGHEERVFLRFLDFLERTHDSIVLLGDTFQAHHGVSLNSGHQSRQIVRIRGRFRELTTRFRSNGYHLVHGNHDEILGRVEGCASKAVFRRDGLGIYCLHGHQFDPVLRGFGPLARFSTWIAGRARVLGLTFLERLFESMDHLTQFRSVYRPGGAYVRGAARILQSEPVQVVVMGHTHVPAIQRMGEAWIANSGTCAGGRFSWVSIDTKERTVRLGKTEEFLSSGGR